MKLNNIYMLSFFTILFALPGCNEQSDKTDGGDPLPSWNDGVTKQEFAGSHQRT